MRDTRQALCVHSHAGAVGIASGPTVLDPTCEMSRLLTLI
jgi:hypothetical protein